MMKRSALAFLALTLFAPLVGCGTATTPAAKPLDPKAAAKEEKYAAALAKLSPEDRKLAEAQKFCALATESRLGAMGPPVKVEIEGQSVFLCCDGCKEDALANPKETLAKVEKLKAENK